MSVILTFTLLSRNLKKNHNENFYHRMRETVVDGAISLEHVSSDNNDANILTKALSGSKDYALCKPFMFTEIIDINYQH